MPLRDLLAWLDEPFRTRALVEEEECDIAAFVDSQTRLLRDAQRFDAIVASLRSLDERLERIELTLADLSLQ